MTKTRIMLAAAGVSALTAFGSTPTMHPYTVPASSINSRDRALGCLKADEIVKAGGKLELGKWYTDFTTCKKYCDDNGIPLLAVWSNAGCVHCWYTDYCFTAFKGDTKDLSTDFMTFKEWASTHDAGKVIYCFMAGGESGCPDQSGSTAYNWMWKGGSKTLDAYPFVALWWKKGGINYHVTGDKFCYNANGTQPSNFMSDKSIPTRITNIIEKMSAQFKDWHPEPEVTYDGGWFTQTNYPYASLQAESTTKSVAVEIVRDSIVATNQSMTIAAPGKASSTVTVEWAANEMQKTVTISNFNTKWFVKGKDVTLTLLDHEGEAVSTVTIACVAPENSTGNPKWKGCDEFGVWTMDLDAAKAKVRNTSGKAYTVVCVQGSQWCPDCGNVEANFLGQTDSSGNNRFAQWAKSKNIALVTIDIPNFKSESVDATSPCLLKKDAYLTSPDGTKAWHSGLGYLTRNEISDAEASAALSRNHDLVSKNTYAGGFHRPEDGNAYRTGVPIFVLLDKAGNVRARLTRFAYASPSADDGKKYFENYLKRFEEMIEIAENNATEIENNYPSASNELTLRANGGSETASLSHTDPMDVFRLDGVGGNALQSVKVTGDSDAKLIVSLVTTNASGTVETLATSGEKTLSDGIELEHTFDKAGSYFVKVEVADITSEDFKVESASSTFRPYTVKGSVVLVPQEDKATAKPPAGSDKVTIKLDQGTRYYITGMDSCAALQPVAGAPAGFYVATQGGNAEMTLTRVDGEVTYQIWNSGSVGFDETARSVQESVCDEDGEPLEISVSRGDGKSGWAKMTVAVDWEATTLPANRFWLCETNSVGNVEVEWRDGETGAKTVKLYVDDSLSKGLYDGTTKVTLIASVDSEAGDVGIVPGKESFELTVLEDDTQDPGKAFIFAADPVFVRTCTVFARESDGAKLWAKRVDGSDGLVAGLLVSSVKGTVFATEDPRDLETLEDVLPGMSDLSPLLKDAKFLYWASRETKEKYVKVTGIPAGKTARVVFRPVDNLKGISSSNTVTIVSVADDAPAFERANGTAELIRYVEQNPVEFAVTNLVEEGVVSFRKISGTLPAGVKVGFVRTTDTAGVMTLSGVPTAKAGTYESVYQVSEKRDGVAVNGLAMHLAITIADPIMAGVPGMPDPVPAVRKTRTFKDIPVMTENGTRLMGLLQVTIPPTGRVSAKYQGVGGTVSYAGKSWTGYSPSPSGWELQAAMNSNVGDYAMLGLAVESDGSIGANLKFKDDKGDYVTYLAVSDGKIWTKDDSAEDYKGYYTVALRHKDILAEDESGVAPTGDGYMTLKMNTAAACYRGAFTVAGRLPNGTTFSGSSVLGLSEGKALLPVFRKSSKDVLAVLTTISANAQEEENRRCVKSPTLCDGYWKHTEREELKGSYEVSFQACGSYYDTKEDLGACCAEYYETTDLLFYFDGKDHAAVTVEDNTVRIDTTQPNLLLVTLSFNRSTGIITGASKHPSLGARISYAGIVVNGWGEGCGCSAEGPFLPFMSGSYFYRDGSLTMGGSATIDK